MSIDPSDFVKQGKPTPQQVKAVWDELKRPSTRKVAKMLEQRGFSISYRTIARLARIGKWEGFPCVTGHESNLEKGRPKKVNGAMRAEVDRLTDREHAAFDANGLENALAPPPDIDEWQMLEARRGELLNMSEAELDRAEAKTRKILNILLMEQASRRANLMILVPKETSALVSAMTEASGAQLTGGANQPPEKGDPRVIDAYAETAEGGDHNDAARELDRFLADAGRRPAKVA